MEACFAENRQVLCFLFFVFFPLEDGWKGGMKFSWSKCLREHVIFGKSISVIQETVDDGVVLVQFITLCWSSLGFTDAGLC